MLAEKPKLYNLFWETTLRCNAKCKHCGSRAGENIKLDDELTTEEIKNALQSIDNKLEYHWEMTTNGILINESNIDKMKKTGMTTVSISLDGLEQSHDEFRGVKGSSFFQGINALIPDVPGCIKIRFPHTQRDSVLHLIYDIKKFADTGGLDIHDLIC